MRSLFVGFVDEIHVERTVDIKERQTLSHCLRRASRPKERAPAEGSSRCLVAGGRAKGIPEDAS